MKILIIEDEEKLCKALKKGLEQEGYAVDYVLDGRSGRQRMELCEKEYDLAILDLMLPEESGVEVAKAVREKGITIPILVLTARGTIEDKVEALDVGADDYLMKPFSFGELMARVRALMRRPNQSLPSELKVGEIMLNPATREVFKSEKRVPLTLKEYAILEYLMRNPNIVVTREQLLEHVWDFAFDSFSNVVDVHIKNLRKKLGDKNDKTLKTIRGIGYKIVA